MKTGFYAKTRAEEAKCPDLELNVLEDSEDVTQKVNASAKPVASVAEQGQARRAAHVRDRSRIAPRPPSCAAT